MEPSVTVSSLHALLETATSADSLEAIHALCSELCEVCGFDHFIYGAQFPTSFIKPQAVVISGFPIDWWEHYNKKEYIKIDPTITHCSRHLTPLVWEDLDREGSKIALDAKKMMGEAQDYGLRSGISFPIRGHTGESAILSLVSQDGHKKASGRITQALPYGQLLVGFIHEAARRVFERKQIRIGNAQLTDREKQCLLWAAEGKTAWETAQILNISERTVLFHLQNVASKLNVSNRQHAVARAVSQALIAPQFDTLPRTLLSV